MLLSTLIIVSCLTRVSAIHAAPGDWPYRTTSQTTDVESTPLDQVSFEAALMLDDEGGENEESESDEGDAESIDIADRFATIDDTFESLEQSIDEVAKKANNPSIVTSGSSKSTMRVVGRVHVDAWGFDTKPGSSFNGGDPRNRLGFRRLRFGVRGNVKDNMEYRIEMEFAGGVNSQFRDAYLGWNDLPFFQTLLIGNQKRPYGLDHLNSSRYNVFIERPFVIEGFNQDARRLGIGSYGVSEDESWNWRFGVWNQRNIQALGNYIGDHLQLEVAGRMANTIWYDKVSGGRGYAHWAISGTHADSTDNATPNEARFRTRPEARTTSRWLDTNPIAGSDYFNLIGFEGVINVGRLQVVGEYQSVWVDRIDGQPNTRFDGGYVYVALFLTDDYMPWSRSSGTLARIIPLQNFWLVNRCDGGVEGALGAWQIAARWSTADFSDQNVFGGQGDAFTFGLNWYWTPNARMQFNYINGRISDRRVGASPTGLAQNGQYNVFGSRFMIDF